MLRFGAQARSRKRSTGSKGIPVTIKVASRLLSVAAFAYGTSDQNDFDRSFDHRIDIVVILFKHERCAINAAIGQFKRWRWPL